MENYKKLIKLVYKLFVIFLQPQGMLTDFASHTELTHDIWLLYQGRTRADNLLGLYLAKFM